MSGFDLDAAFSGGKIPPWLGDFAATPDISLQDFLLGRAELGHLSAAEPVNLLLGWLDALGTRGGFDTALDAALARWIERAWGHPTLPLPGGSAPSVAMAWVAVCDLLASEPRLTTAARSLRRLFPEHRAFLNGLSEGRAHDPEGRAWLALARHQEDRTLVDRWWQLCRLPPDVPWYHGAYGIAGLRGLPAADPHHAGTFPQEVAEGLAHLAQGLGQRVDEGWLESKVAAEELQRTARQTMNAYPWTDKARWRSFWRHALAGRLLTDEKARKFVAELFPTDLDREAPAEERLGRSRRGAWREPDPAWGRQAQEIAPRLAHWEEAAIDSADGLIRAQAQYAEATGDPEPLGRSIGNFAPRILARFPAKALAWLELGHRHAPWNAHLWTIRSRALLALGRPAEALATGVQATHRFPGNPIVRTGLAEVLKELHRLDEAEATYRETIRLFPNSDAARNGLAGVLITLGRFEEAAASYHEALRIKPGDRFAREGLEKLQRQNRSQGKAARPSSDAVAGRPSARFVAKPGGRRTAFEIREEAPPYDPGAGSGTYEEPGLPPEPSRDLEPPTTALRTADIETLLQDAYLLRLWRQNTGSDPRETPDLLRERTRQVLDALAEVGDQDPPVVSERSLLLLAEGNLEPALALLRQAALRYPGSVRVRYALARAEREAARKRGSLDEGDPYAPAHPWRRLSQLDPRLQPLHWLGEGRTWLGQRNGTTVADNARQCLGRLGHWISRRRQDGAESSEATERGNESAFAIWWAERVERWAFAGATVRGYEEVPDLEQVRAAFVDHANGLDSLEEAWLGHLDRA